MAVETTTSALRAIIFPEIGYDKVDALRGLNINILTKTDEECKALTGFRFPFKNWAITRYGINSARTQAR
jgi:hypothetical protein